MIVVRALGITLLVFAIAVSPFYFSVSLTDSTAEFQKVCRDWGDLGLFLANVFPATVGFLLFGYFSGVSKWKIIAFSSLLLGICLLATMQASTLYLEPVILGPSEIHPSCLGIAASFNLIAAVPTFALFSAAISLRKKFQGENLNG